MISRLVLLAALRLVLGFTFSLDANSITECGSTTVTWQGGQPPFALMILSAFGTTDNITVPDSAWSGDSNSGTLSWTVNYSNGTEFLAVMSDTSGFGNGGASPIYKVSSAQKAASCQVKEQSGTGVAFRLNATSISQCQPVNIQWLSPWSNTVIAAVAGGQVAQLGKADSGLNWTPNAPSGSEVIIAGFNNYTATGGGFGHGGAAGPGGGLGGHGGGPWGGWGGHDNRRATDSNSLWDGGYGITSIAFTIGDGPSDCLKGSAPGIPSSSSPAPEPTTLIPSPSPSGSDGPAPSSTSASVVASASESAAESGLPTGALIGVSAGGIAVLSAVLAAFLFLCLKRRRRNPISGAGMGDARDLKPDQFDLLHTSPSNTPHTTSFHNPYDTAQTLSRQTTSIGQVTSTGYRTEPFDPTRTYQYAYSTFSHGNSPPHSPYQDEPSPDTSPTTRSVNFRPTPGRTIRVDTAMLYPPVSNALHLSQDHSQISNPYQVNQQPSPSDPLSPRSSDGHQPHPGLSTPIFGNAAVCPSPILPSPHPFASSYAPKKNRGANVDRRISQYSALTSIPSSDEDQEPEFTKIATWTVQNPSQASLHTHAFGGIGDPPSRPVSGGLLLHQDAGRLREEEEEPAEVEELPPTYRHEWERMSGRRV